MLSEGPAKGDFTGTQWGEKRLGEDHYDVEPVVERSDPRDNRLWLYEEVSTGARHLRSSVGEKKTCRGPLIIIASSQSLHIIEERGFGLHVK